LSAAFEPKSATANALWPPGAHAIFILRMRPSLVFAILLALAAGGAESPPAPTEPLPDARLFYESDTRAYYRPCG